MRELWLSVKEMSYPPLSQSPGFLHRATANRQNPINDASAVVEGDKVHLLVTCD